MDHKQFMKKVVDGYASTSESEDGDPTFGDVEVDNEKYEDHYGTYWNLKVKNLKTRKMQNMLEMNLQ